MGRRAKAILAALVLLPVGAWALVESGGFNYFPGITLNGSGPQNQQINLTAGKRICFDGAPNCFGYFSGDTNGVTTQGGLVVSATDYIQTANTAELSNNSGGLGLYVNDLEGLCVGDGTGNQSIPTSCDGELLAAITTSPPQTHNVANDGAGSAPATTLTPTSSVVLIDYDDVTAGSVGTISETGAQEGQELKGCHTGAGGTVVFTEVAGQQEIGGTACTLALSDCFEAVYMNASWHFLSCRDN